MGFIFFDYLVLFMEILRIFVTVGDTDGEIELRTLYVVAVRYIPIRYRVKLRSKDKSKDSFPSSIKELNDNPYDPMCSLRSGFRGNVVVELHPHQKAERELYVKHLCPR